MEKQLVQPQQPQPQPQQPQQPQQQPSVVASVVAPPLQSGTPMIAGQASDCNNKIDNIPFCDDKYYKFKKHVCDICGYRTDVPYSLRRHKKKVHNVGTILSPKKKKGIVVHSNEPMSIDDDDDDEEDDIDDDDSRGRSVERKCGVCPNDTDPLPPLPTTAPAQEPMLTTIVMILIM